MDLRTRRPSPAMVVACAAFFVALSTGSYAAIKANAIGAKQIKSNAVRGAEIKNGAVNGGEVADGSLTGDDVDDSSLGSGDVGDESLTGGDIQDGSLGGGDVGDESLTGGDVQDGSLSGGDVGDESLGSNDVDGLGPRDVTGLTRGSFASGELPPQAFARVQANGTLQPNVAGFPAQNGGTVLVSKGEGGAATGTYCFDVSFRPASALVTLDNADAGANVDQIVSVAIDRGEDLGDCPANRNDARVRILDTDLAAGVANDPGPADARFFIWFIQ